MLDHSGLTVSEGASLAPRRSDDDEDPVETGPSALACYGRSRTRTWDLFLIREAL
jgi:hypothetical protein